MSNLICYAAVENSFGVIRTADNRAATRPPEIVLGVPCELELRLFDGLDTTDPLPLERFSGVAGWSFEMDSDFSSLSTVKLVADNADIVLSEVTEGGVTYTRITIPIRETYTAELAAALGARETLTLAGELVAYDAGHEPVDIIQFKSFVVRGRVAGLGKPTPIPTAAYDELARQTVAEAMSSGGYVTGSGAAAIASGAAVSVVAPVSGGLQTQIGTLSGGLLERPTSAEASAIAKQVAIPKNSAWTTTVGGYTIEHTANGVSVYGSGASATLRGGAVTVSASESISADYYSEELGGSAGLYLGYNRAALQYDDGMGGTASVEVRDGGQTDITGGLNVLGGITANGSAITQVSSEFSGTSLGIAKLSGGVKYICQSPLSALSIGSAAPGCNAAFLFTLANGAVVTPPANVPLFGVSAYTPGSRYAMAVNGDMAVVAEAVGV